jgi:glycosyltransferase involved in cell wall biosynthesis
VAGGHTGERAALSGPVSLVVTVLNESATIDTLLESVLHQTRAPDEVVIVDGGSTDGTWERLLEWRERLPLVTIRATGASISQGRNQAISASHGDLVAITDAGVRLEPTWLERLLAEARPEVDVVSGFFKADADTAFERAMGATVLPEWRDVQETSFLPSSRSVLVRRSAWQTVGGYPEWLDYCEDLVFDLRLREAGCQFATAPEAVVSFRPRGSVRAFFRQYFLYARGDGKADLYRGRHAIRYGTYLALVLLLAWLNRAPLLIGSILLAGVVAYTRRPYARLTRSLTGMSLPSAAYAVMLVPVIRAVGDVAKMAGYPAGVAWRLRAGRKQ